MCFEGDAQGPKLNYFVMKFIFWGPCNVRASTFGFGGEHVGREDVVNVVEELNIVLVEWRLFVY